MNQCMSCHPLMRTSQEVNMGVSETVSKILHLCRSRCSLYTQILQTVSSSQRELSLKFKSNHSIEVWLLIQNKSRFTHILYLFWYFDLALHTFTYCIYVVV